MQTHLALRTLQGADKPDKDVQSLFAVRPSGKAILFIHGFSGDPIKTWSDFHVLLPAAQGFKGRDLYFYGYDGLRANMTSSAALLREFLERLFQQSSKFVNQNLPSDAKRQDNFQYDEVALVAHSLGAVITRRALLDLTRLNRPWLSKTRLILFAPAHKGASVADLALEAASSFRFLRFFGAIARFESPLIDQLKPGSPELTALLRETELACQNGANSHLKARQVVIAEYERIVRNETFADDPPPVTIPDTEHTSVCKPRADFLRPFELLEESL
jgi:alpha-beta hydrolase superfamily lysophospholipase